MNIVAESDLAPGEHMTVEVEDGGGVLFNLGGEFFAVEDVCTHDGSEIGSGCIVGEDIECPRHGARFSIRTGEVTAPPAYEPIDTFPVRVEQGVVQIRDHRWD